MSTGDHGSAVVPDRPVTFGAAMELGGFELARQWADRLSWPWPTQRTARDDLAELAYMSALAEWLRRWQPIHINAALLGNGQLEDVSAAFSGSPADAFRCWHEWASAQRNLGIAEEEYTKIMSVFASARLNRADDL